jgi:hypothetical protein
VHEILNNLGPGQRVLDIGSNAGSFDSTIGPFIAIRADLDHPSRSVPNFAQADAAHLPFAERSRFLQRTHPRHAHRGRAA